MIWSNRTVKWKHISWHHVMLSTRLSKCTWHPKVRRKSKCCNSKIQICRTRIQLRGPLWKKLGSKFQNLRQSSTISSLINQEILTFLNSLRTTKANLISVHRAILQYRCHWGMTTLQLRKSVKGVKYSMRAWWIYQAIVKKNRLKT